MVVDDTPAPKSRAAVSRRARRSPNGKVAVRATRVRAATPEGNALVDDHVFLCGRPSLRHYISFVKDLAVQRPDDRTLSEEWHEANDEVERRQKTEAGLADDLKVAPLPRALRGLRDRLLEDPLYHHAFDSAPAEVGIVELDRMVVYQKHIDQAHAGRLREKIGRKPTDEQIFRICLPFDHPKPPVSWMRTHSDTFVFVSPSNDIRYLGTMQLEPRNIADYPPPGNLVGVIGLAVGFGSNFLNAIRVDGRVILNNGSHRAYALRAAGITHVPCIVQTVSSRDELLLVASSDLKRNPDRYLKPKRPPMLKDYFDPKLHKVIPCVRRLRQIRIKFSTDDSDFPAV